MARIIGLRDYGKGELEYREQQVRFWFNEKQLVLAMADFLERGEKPQDDKYGGLKLNREFLHGWIREQVFALGNSYIEKLERRDVFEEGTLEKAHELVKTYLTEKGCANKEYYEEITRGNFKKRKA